MQRPSPWLLLVVLLLGILLLREPRFAEMEDGFLHWLMEHSQGTDGPPLPLTVVEIGHDAIRGGAAPDQPGNTPPRPAGEAAISPLEFALFLQSTLDFQPSVVAFENILKWRERDKDQEQVFLDQAMRVPKLLLASELSSTADPDAPWGDIRGFPQVTGKRGDLPAFSGIGRQPGEDLRLISTQGFVNFPEEIPSSIRVPLLFLYRGEVIPSFPLQAILLWQRVVPSEVKIDLAARYILLPQNRKIPIQSDGTMLVDPNIVTRAHRLSLNELLLAAQQHDAGHAPGQPFTDLHNNLVLARTPDNPLSPPDLYAATIATIQGNSYVRRISPIFDCVFLLLLAIAASSFRNFARMDLLLCGVAFSAAYCLIALGTLSHWQIWLPGVLPLGVLWIFIIGACVFRKKSKPAPEERVPAATA